MADDGKYSTARALLGKNLHTMHQALDLKLGSFLNRLFIAYLFKFSYNRNGSQVKDVSDLK